jgi:hypothetical protein
MALQVGYFCFKVFITELLIRCGHALKSPGVAVSAPAVAYFAAHFAVVPILRFSSSTQHACGAIALFAGFAPQLEDRREADTLDDLRRCQNMGAGIRFFKSAC